MLPFILPAGMAEPRQVYPLSIDAVKLVAVL